jgi:hypothetical protein
MNKVSTLGINQKVSTLFEVIFTHSLAAVAPAKAVTREAVAPVAYENLRTARACYHRIQFIGFWECASVAEAQLHFAQWYAEARRSQLEPVRKVALTLKDHLLGLLEYFNYRITNAVSGDRRCRQAAKTKAADRRPFTPACSEASGAARHACSIFPGWKGVFCPNSVRGR